MGISVQSSGIAVEKSKFYLVNLNADPSMNELLVYYLKVILLLHGHRFNTFSPKGGSSQKSIKGVYFGENPKTDRESIKFTYNSF